MRGEKRRGSTKKLGDMFSLWRSRCNSAQRLDVKRKCVCAGANRVQNRCDQQVFPPQELAVGAPGLTVRVEPAGAQRHGSVVALHYGTPR